MGEFYDIPITGGLRVRGINVPMKKVMRVFADSDQDAHDQARLMMGLEVELAQKKIDKIWAEKKRKPRMAISIESKDGVFTVVTHGMKPKGGTFDTASKLMDYVARELFGNKEILWSETRVPEMDHDGSCYEIIWTDEGLDTRCYVPNGLHRNLAAQRVYNDLGILLTCMGRWAGAEPYVDTFG